MATIVGTGISSKLDSFAAGKEAALTAYYQIGKNDPGIIIAFISTIFDQDSAIKGIHSIIKDTPLIGCSSVGAISSHGSHRDSVSVFIISSNSIKFSCGVGEGVSKNPRSSGNTAAKQTSTAKYNSKQAYIMFSDSMSGNSADILRGAQEELGTGFTIIGGGASNRSLTPTTYQYKDNKIYTDSVVGALIAGDIKLGVGNSNGWRPIGKPHKVTKVKYNTIKEIDKKIAVEIYEEYFEKSFEELKTEGVYKLGLNYPIGMQWLNKDTKEYITRAPIKIDDGGGIVLNADIREGKEISLMIGDKEWVLESAKIAASKAMDSIKNPRIKFAIMLSDISRLFLLRKDAKKEIDTVRDVIGKNVPILGCYTFGEYMPFNANESSSQFYFNNQSVSIALFSE